MKNEILYSIFQKFLNSKNNKQTNLSLNDKEFLENINNLTENQIKELIYKNISITKIKESINEFKNKKQTYSIYSEILGHVGLIERIAIDNSKKETYVFTGGIDGLIKLWSIDEGMLIRSFYGHRGTIVDICISNCGKFLVTVDITGLLIVWNLTKIYLNKNENQPLININQSLENNNNLNINQSLGNNLNINQSLENNLNINQSLENNLNINQSLENNVKLHQIDFKKEIIFCEFLKDNINNEKNTLNVIFTEGVILPVYFDLNEIQLGVENESLKSLLGISTPLKAICITDGGRLIGVGGDWNYFVLFDAFSSNELILLEDFSKTSVNIQISNICASRNSLKIATSAANTICIYTYNNFGGKNPKKHSDKKYSNFTSFGNLNKTIIDLYDTIEDQSNIVIIHRMSFLTNYLLVTVCTDGIIRIYEDSHLIKTIKGEVGEIYVHPTKNIFAIVGDYIRIYEIDKNINILLDQILIFQLTDALFSNNGFYFISVDSRGVLRTYSIFNLQINSPKEQFFIQDFENLTENIVNDYCFLWDYCYDSSRNINLNWKFINYKINNLEINKKYISVENGAAQYLSKYKFNNEQLKEKYLKLNNVSENINYEEDESEEMFIRRTINSYERSNEEYINEYAEEVSEEESSDFENSEYEESDFDDNSDVEIASDTDTSTDTESSTHKYYSRKEYDLEKHSRNNERKSRSGRNIRGRFLDDSS